MKICCTCKINKNDSEFYKNKSVKGGLHRRCIECHLKKDAIQRDKNRVEIRIRTNERAALPENRLKKKEYNHRRYLEKREEILAQNAAWKQFQYNNNAEFRFKKLITDALWRAFNVLGAGKRSKRTREILNLPEGILFDDYLFDKLGFIPTNSEKYQIDHIFPLSKARNKFEAQRLNDCRNLRLLSSQENHNKSDKILPEALEIFKLVVGYEYNSNDNIQPDFEEENNLRDIEKFEDEMIQALDDDLKELEEIENQFKSEGN